MNKKLLFSLLIHVAIAWLLLNIAYLLPYLYRVYLWGDYLWNMDGSATTAWQYFSMLHQKSNLQRLLKILLIFIPLVELNYWFVIKNKNFGKSLFTSLMVGLVSELTLLFPWNQLAFANDPFGPIYRLFALFSYAMIYGLIRRYIHDRAYERKMILQRTENELKALKAQLNPHFFFNSLNYLYGTALKEKAVETSQLISMLSDMMRYTVTGVHENFVPLEKELEFINNFFSLQKARLPLSDSIKVDTSIVWDGTAQLIAPLIVLPFIENAFKYGVSIDYPCSIAIGIDVRNDQLTMNAKNRIIKEREELKGNNTGMANSKKRLELLYPGKHTLTCVETETDYEVNLSLTLK